MTHLNPSYPALAAAARQARRWGWALAAALGLHAWLLWGLPGWTAGPAAERAESRPRTVVLQARTLAAAPRPGPPVPPVAGVAAAPVDASPALPAPLRSGPRAITVAPDTVSPPLPAATAGLTAQHARFSMLPEPSSPGPQELQAQQAHAESAAGEPPPLYAAQLAPPATLHFTVTRGPGSGSAVLRWQPDHAAHRYALQFEVQAVGVPIAERSSSGGFDEAGLAPERYAESRRRREVRATNFQRAAGKISFSAQSVEYPLLPGVQDRHSWLLQLGAILQANPALAQANAQISMLVVGTRGAPEPWVFTVVERGPLVLGAGSASMEAVYLRREPRRPYDIQVDVWLDPAQHHLPLKLQLLVHTGGEGQVFELQQLSFP